MSYKLFKICVKVGFTFCLIAFIGYPAVKELQATPSHPLKIQPPSNNLLTKVFDISEIDVEEGDDATFSEEDLFAAIPDFVNTPEGGTPWEVLGKIGMNSYSFIGEDGDEWTGVRPGFNDEVKKLDGTEILLQGYMFPLDQNEKQSMFLLGPFPVSCPYHYHVTPSMVIEVHAKTPLAFSYDPVNIKGTLELVPQDDEYNVFYRLKEARIAK